MNRLIIVGNGFDLAHGLRTRYEHFIDWYWEQWVKRLQNSYKKSEQDELCTFTINDSYPCWQQYFIQLQQQFPKEKWNNILDTEIIRELLNNNKVCSHKKCLFFNKICESIETKNWVDIENIFYQLLIGSLKNDKSPLQINQELEFIKNQLIQYLTKIEKNNISDDIINPDLKHYMLEPFDKEDIAVEAVETWNNMLQQRLNYTDNEWTRLITKYHISHDIDWFPLDEINDFKQIFDFNKVTIEDIPSDRIPPTFRLPDNVLVLNFNYTTLADRYLPQENIFKTIHIHGELNNPKGVIFGYGDEFDDFYSTILKKNDNSYLQHFKSYKYLEASNYRQMRSFIEAAPYQIYIMGHSCGLSDKTLLKTLFEHKNCISIKPFYYIKEDGSDSYMETIQNISRSFTDMTLLRDRVVNKTRCHTM